MRAAVYFSPPADHPLTVAAGRWLGRDATTGEALQQPLIDGFDPAEFAALTAEPRRYGFHATMKPPFRLAAGTTLADVETAMPVFCRGLAPILMRGLRLERLGAFFALTPVGPEKAINALAADVVQFFDRFRAPPSSEEIERRRPDRLTTRQREYLQRWGYPYVLDEFRFHMTLTGPVPTERQERMARALSDAFGGFLAEPLAIDALSLFVEPAPMADFVERKRVGMNAAGLPMDAA
jgi:putative phosphonate metabolism protein